MATRLPSREDLGARPLPSGERSIAQVGNVTAPGRALAQAGQAAMELGDALYKRDAENQLNEFRTRLNELEVERVHDPEKGYKALKKGKDAVDGLQAFDEEFGKTIDGEVGKLTNAAARRAAAEMAASRRAQVRTSLSGYAAQENERYEAQVYDDAKEASLARVMADPTTLEAEQRVSQVATLARARRLGMPPEQALAENIAALNGAVIDGYLARKEYVKAYEHFDKANGEKKLGKLADNYSQRVETARQLVQSTTEFDRIRAVDPALGEKAYDEAKKIADPVIRKAVEGSIDHEVNRREAMRSRAERQVRVTANQKLYASDALKSIDEVFTADELASIDRQPGLRQSLVAEQTRRLQGLEVQTDPREFDRLRTMAGRDPDAFMREDISQHYGKLSIQHRDYLEGLQASLKDPSKRVEVASEQAQLRKYSDLMGIKGGDKGDKVRGMYQQAYDAAKAAFVAHEKREPNYAEREAIFKSITLPFMRDKKNWFGSEQVPAFKLQPGDENVRVPSLDRQQIIAAFREEFKREPTEQEILREYVTRPR